MLFERDSDETFDDSSATVTVVSKYREVRLLKHKCLTNGQGLAYRTSASINTYYVIK